MALTSNSNGSLHPGGNPKSIFGSSGSAGTEIYRVPAGRMAFLTDIYGGVRINADREQTQYTPASGGAPRSMQVYVTEGDVVYALSNGTKFFGIEFDI